ncbi:MAG TPA: hypothetical protein VGE86_10710, partial [Thermoanaerobaculia bacterium]
MPDTSVLLLALLVFAVGAAAGWLVAAARKGAALHRAEAERDAARAERERTETALAQAQRRIEDEQKLRAAADTRAEELHRRGEEMARFVEESRTQLEGSYAKLSQAALGTAVEQLLQVVKPHLEKSKGDIVSTLDTKKVEIEGLLGPLRQMLET